MGSFRLILKRSSRYFRPTSSPSLPPLAYLHDRLSTQQYKNKHPRVVPLDNGDVLLDGYLIPGDFLFNTYAALMKQARKLVKKLTTNYGSFQLKYIIDDMNYKSRFVLTSPSPPNLDYPPALPVQLFPSLQAI